MNRLLHIPIIHRELLPEKITNYDKAHIKIQISKSLGFSLKLCHGIDILCCICIFTNLRNWNVKLRS